MADGVVFKAVGVVAVGVGTPGVAADDERLRRVVGVFRQYALLFVELLLQVEQFVGRGAGGGVDEGQAQLAQGGGDRRGFARDGVVGVEDHLHLNVAMGETGGGHKHHLADDLGLARLHPVVVGVDGDPVAPGAAIGAGADVQLDLFGGVARPMGDDGVERDGGLDDLGGEGGAQGAVGRGGQQLVLVEGRALFGVGRQLVGGQDKVGHRVAGRFVLGDDWGRGDN